MGKVRLAGGGVANKGSSPGVQDTNQHIELRYLSLFQFCRVECQASNIADRPFKEHVELFISNINKEEAAQSK